MCLIDLLAGGASDNDRFSHDHERLTKYCGLVLLEL